MSQLSTERVDKPASLFKVGDQVEAGVMPSILRRKIDLSIRPCAKPKAAEMESYLKREKEGSRFSFQSLLNVDLRLDRDEDGQTSRKGR
jgi:predicted RNA-binding protein with RPS1 domain